MVRDPRQRAVRPRCRITVCAQSRRCRASMPSPRITVTKSSSTATSLWLVMQVLKVRSTSPPPHHDRPVDRLSAGECQPQPPASCRTLPCHHRARRAGPPDRSRSPSSSRSTSPERAPSGAGSASRTPRPIWSGRVLTETRTSGNAVAWNKRQLFPIPSKPEPLWAASSDRWIRTGRPAPASRTRPDARKEPCRPVWHSTSQPSVSPLSRAFPVRFCHKTGVCNPYHAVNGNR
jgi:hypothetical protein